MSMADLTNLICVIVYMFLAGQNPSEKPCEINERLIIPSQGVKIVLKQLSKKQMGGQVAMCGHYVVESSKISCRIETHT